MKRVAAFLSAASLALSAFPAQAQFWWQAPDLSGPALTGTEPELALNLPGATPAELRAGILWHMRVALNVAALQCDFEPSLLTVSNYNATLAHHRSELAAAFTALTSYFTRTQGGGAKGGQKGFDLWNTRVYSAYSTTHAQVGFCYAMGRIGREAIFADRGMLTQVAERRMGEARKALKPLGEQYYVNPAYTYRAVLPSSDRKCWRKDTLRPECEKAWLDKVKAQADAPIANR